MKKVVLLCVLLLFGCKEEPTIRGRSYVLEHTGMEITLVFDRHENRYFGKGVNRYYGTYRLAGKVIRFSQPYSTMYSGAEEDMALEEKYLNDLARVQTYSLEQDRLILKTEDGRFLVFRIRPSEKPF